MCSGLPEDKVDGGTNRDAYEMSSLRRSQRLTRGPAHLVALPILERISIPSRLLLGNAAGRATLSPALQPKAAFLGFRFRDLHVVRTDGGQ